MLAKLRAGEIIVLRVLHKHTHTDTEPTTVLKPPLISGECLRLRADIPWWYDHQLEPFFPVARFSVVYEFPVFSTLFALFRLPILDGKSSLNALSNN